MKNGLSKSPLKLLIFAVLVGMLLCHAQQTFTAAASPASKPFYEGKSVSLLIQATTGGIGDLAHLTSRYWGKFIPGTPKFVVRELPGARGMLMANNLFELVAPDGLTVSIFIANQVMQQLSKAEGVKFDVRKVIILGSLVSDALVLAVSPKAPSTNILEIRDKKIPLVFGATGPGASAHDAAVAFRDYGGFSFCKVVKGYRRSSDVLLAMERGEVNAIVFTFGALRRYISEGRLKVILRHRAFDHPDYQRLPTFEDVMEKTGLELIDLIGTPRTMVRVFVAPPNTPSDLVQVLRLGLREMARDPQFVENARKAKIEIKYNSPEEAAEMWDRILRTSPSIVERYIAISTGK